MLADKSQDQSEVHKTHTKRGKEHRKMIYLLREVSVSEMHLKWITFYHYNRQGGRVSKMVSLAACSVPLSWLTGTLASRNNAYMVSKLLFITTILAQVIESHDYVYV